MRSSICGGSRANAAASGRRRERGFTLLEVIVAVAIAGLALVGLFRAGSDGLFAVNRAGRVDEAIERAQSHLAAFGALAAISPGTLEGDDGDGYRWRLKATRLAVQRSTFDRHADLTTALYEVEVTILWRDLGRVRSVALVSRRIGSIAGAP